MKEVSTERVFGFLLVKLDQMGIERARLVEGVPVSLEELTDPSQRMDWAIFVQLMRRFGALVGGPIHLEQAGLLPQSARPSKFVGYALSLVRDPKDLFWAVATMAGPAFFSHIAFDYEEVSENRVRITLTIPPEYEDCPEFFHVYRGNFQSVPLLHGMPAAIVEMEMEPRRAVYTITIPPSMSLFRRFKRAVRAFKGGRGIFEELTVFQQQIRESYERLAEAKQELTEQEVKISLFERMADASHLAALDRLAGGVGHEINNPLMAMALNIDLLDAELTSQTGDRAKMLAQMKAIKEAKDRIATVVSSLVGVGSGNPEVPPQPIALRQVLEHVGNLCTARFAKSGLRFEMERCRADVRVLAQPMLLSQALVHLLNNASDAAGASREKGVRVVVEADDDLVRIRVQDSGSGIPDVFRERIFEPFFSTKMVEHGVSLGLGLSLAKKYVEMQGGTLSLDAESAETCFTISLKRLPDGSEGNHHLA